ncbi:MAG: DUF302 domain-containing protein [bacterium]|nr:DUF302 domain-containing protein [bacterium]
MEFAIAKKATGTIDEVETKITAALKEVGFGILTRIEADKVLKEKIGVETTPYRILGACNPTLAHNALEADPSIGVFLPCSVCLRQEDDGTVSIWALNPATVVDTLNNAELAPHGKKAQDLITSAIDSVANG